MSSTNCHASLATLHSGKILKEKAARRITKQLSKMAKTRLVNIKEQAKDASDARILAVDITIAIYEVSECARTPHINQHVKDHDHEVQMIHVRHCAVIKNQM